MAARDDFASMTVQTHHSDAWIGLLRSMAVAAALTVVVVSLWIALAVAAGVRMPAVEAGPMKAAPAPAPAVAPAIR
jgi:hypothetical protein